MRPAAGIENSARGAHAGGLVYPPFELRQLYYFVTVAEERQITRAAARLHIAQPALSHAISRLETAVGVKLLEREPRRVSLTPAGTAFLEKARLAVTAAREADSVMGLFVRAEGVLVIGSSAGFQPAARPLVRRFAVEHPEVEVRFQEVAPTRGLLELRTGVIDAELMLAPEPAEPGLTMETVVHSPRHVLLASTHPLAGMTELRFDQIAGERFPGLHESLNSRWAKECWLTELRGGDPELTQEKPLTLDELWTLIRTGKAITVLPEFMVAPMVGNGVCAIPLLDVAPFEFALARRSEDNRPLVAALFESARRLDREQTPGVSVALVRDE